MTNAELNTLRILLCKYEQASLVEPGAYKVADALRSAIATIESLPVTKDGYRIVHGMTLYERISADCILEMPRVRGVVMSESGECVTVYFGKGFTVCTMDALFAVRKNAELAARDGQGG